MAAAAAALLPAVPASAEESTVERIAGEDRYATAEAVAEMLHPDTASTAVVAAGTTFADALPAGVAAAALDAPLLLASVDDVPVGIIRRLGVEEVLVVGGTAALPTSVVTRLEETGASVRRIAGDDRFETSRRLAAVATPDATRTFRAPGESFATALVAAVHAARVGARLLLEPGLDDDAVDIGGAVLRGTPGALNTELLHRFPSTSDTALVATLASFPDALSASAAAGALGAPVLFTERWSATQPSVDLLRELEPSTVLVIGGTAAVSERVLQQLFGFTPLPPTVPPGAEDAIALDLFARANDERAARGVAALQWDSGLAADAQAWAEEMARSGLRHGTFPATVGENIHALVGSSRLPRSGDLHVDWMHAAGNRDNLVEPGYVIAGVGVACAPDGTLYAVERFGVGFERGVSDGGSPAEPIARPDRNGFDCSGANSS